MTRSKTALQLPPRLRTTLLRPPQDSDPVDYPQRRQAVLGPTRGQTPGPGKDAWQRECVLVQRPR